MQLYGLTMAPAGKGMIKVELFSRYSYWENLARDRARYEEEKEKVARQVIDLLESYFRGIKNQIEVIDVPLLTWERFMGGTRGFCNGPHKEMSIGGMLGGMGIRVPGLDNFYFAGTWATAMGALFMNALSGKRVIQDICHKEGRVFA